MSCTVRAVGKSSVRRPHKQPKQGRLSKPPQPPDSDGVMEDGSRRLQLVILPGFEIVEILLAPPADAAQLNYALVC